MERGYIDKAWAGAHAWGSREKKKRKKRMRQEGKEEKTAHLCDEVVGRFYIAVHVWRVLRVEKRDGFGRLGGHVESPRPGSARVRVWKGVDDLVQRAAPTVLDDHPELGWRNAHLSKGARNSRAGEWR